MEFNATSFKDHNVSEDEIKKDEASEKKTFDFANLKAALFKDKVGVESPAVVTDEVVISPAIFVDTTQFEKNEELVYDAEAVAQITAALKAADERKVFHIDVGDLPAEKVEEFIEEVKKDFEAPKIPLQKNEKPPRVVKPSGQKNG